MSGLFGAGFAPPPWLRIGAYLASMDLAGSPALVVVADFGAASPLGRLKSWVDTPLRGGDTHGVPPAAAAAAGTDTAAAAAAAGADVAPEVRDAVAAGAESAAAREESVAAEAGAVTGANMATTQISYSSYHNSHSFLLPPSLSLLHGALSLPAPWRPLSTAAPSSVGGRRGAEVQAWAAAGAVARCRGLWWARRCRHGRR